MKQQKGLFAYIKNEVRYSKFCSYGEEYSSKAKELGHSQKRLLSSEEHSKMSAMDFKGHFQSIEALKQWYFSYLNNINKLEALSVVGEMARGGDCRNVLSLGSGPSVLEYCLKDMFWDTIHIIVADYDRYMVTKVSQLMPELKAMVFDFYKDDPAAVVDKYHIDTVIMFGSACSMDDKTYFRF